MKTRELLTCDIKVFSAKVDKLKPKDLYQHIGRVSAPLGERDPGAMMDAVIQSVFAGGNPPDSSGEEMGRVFDAIGGRIHGAEMVGPKGENLAHLLAWCIEQDLTVGRLLRMPFYHPVIEEALQAALYDLYAKVEAKNQGGLVESERLAD